jgi:RNA polymerase sigma-70 factor (ECF subfamily)
MSSASSEAQSRPDSAQDSSGMGEALPIGLSVNAFNRAVQDHADAVFRYVLAQCRNEADARDAVQNAFEALWRKREGVHPARVKAWLFRTAYHDMIDGIRKRQRIDLVESYDEALPGDPGAGYNGLGETLRKAMEALPEIQRAVVQLRDYEGYSYREIGTITDLSESQVKVYIYRARKRLQQLLGSIDAHC